MLFWWRLAQLLGRAFLYFFMGAACGNRMFTAEALRARRREFENILRASAVNPAFLLLVAVQPRCALRGHPGL